MTREKAIRLLTTKRAQPSTDYQMAEVYTMAIQALSQEPCDDVVSRDAVKELIKCGVSTDTYDDVEQVCKWIDALPSVTQKSGKWIRYKDNCLYNQCSYCGASHCREDNFCPNCGAKMESEDKE